MRFFVIFSFLWCMAASSASAAMTAAELKAAGLDATTVNTILAQSAFSDDIRNLDTTIAAKKTAIDAHRKKSQEYERIIAQKQKEAATLKNQVSLLDNRIAKAKVDITLTGHELDTVELEIKRLNATISQKQGGISQRQEELRALLNSLNKDYHRSPWEILLVFRSFSALFDSLVATERVAASVSDASRVLEVAKQSLSNERGALQQKNKDLTTLEKKLKGQRFALEEDQEARVFVLQKTRASEALYQKFLAEQRAEEQRLNAEIAGLEQEYRKKLQARGQLMGSDLALQWPVPQNGISTRFHDTDYPFRRVYEHPGLDLRTLLNGKSSNGVPVLAAEKGYVAKAKDAGMGYSYVMVLHNKGVTTVYGHVSKILVAEGQFVTKGQIIALSGGKPGTPGAGRLTTGPHLHFEVRVNGVPVDPLAYLP